MSKPNTSIPLICTLCPKIPNFSDISHLLTHISSKSHLATRFKLQIRSQAEPEARKQLDIFDTWYDNNGLENLLTERLATKQVKKEAKDKKERSKACKQAKPAVSYMLSMEDLCLLYCIIRSKKRRGKLGNIQRRRRKARAGSRTREA